MRHSRLLAIVGTIAITFMLFGIGTEAWGQLIAWDGGGGDNYWNTPENWVGDQVPSGNQTAYFSSNTSVFIQQATTTPNLVVAAGYLLTLRTNSTLTVSGALALGPGSAILLDTVGAAITALQLNGAVSFESGSSNAPTQIYSAPIPFRKQRVALGSTSSLTMGTSGEGLMATYFGTGVDVWLQNPSGMLQSDCRVNGVLTAACEFNLGEFNIWLGKDSQLRRSATNNQNQKFFSFTSQFAATGMLIKSADFWKTAGSYTPGDIQFFEFPVGSEKNVSIFVDVRFAHEIGELAGVVYPAVYDANNTIVNEEYTCETAWAPSGEMPFRGVGIRAVHEIHPKNMASNRYEYYWVVQNIGLFQDYNDFWFIEDGNQEIYWNRTSVPSGPHGPSTPNQICFKVEFQPGYIQGSPQNVFASRYTNNYEDWPDATMGWYADGSYEQPTSSTTGRVLIEMCPTSGFGDITISVAGDPAPVELTSFSARYLDGKVSLKWETATELNNFGFAIERSADGKDWEEVGFVPGYGTSSSPKYYDYMDYLTGDAMRQPQLAYRLRQMDRDGTTDYSNIVFIKTGELPEGAELYAAYPNPFNPTTTISFAIGNPSNVTLRVYNALGQNVATLLRGSAMDAGLYTVPFNGDQFPSGIYMAVLEANGTVQYQKLVLNK